MEGNLIALFEFEESQNGIVISSEKHYRLVSPDSVTLADLEMYRHRAMV